ncbi:MAG: hypothetical protein PHT99_07715 [Methanoregula sp.]|nr:hypothetical protein [Methanoregula sp.]
MNKKTLVIGSLLAVGICAVLICVGMVTGFSVARPFISVDPVSDKNVGDQFTITGTTSLPAGTEILAEVYPASFEDQMGTGSGEFNGATGTITIAGSMGSSNTWAFPVDSSTFKPREYLVTVSSFKGDPSNGDYAKGDLSGTTRFTLHAGSGTAGGSPGTERAVAGGILIDPIQDSTVGDPLVVTGKTNLSAGTVLTVKVIPVSMDNSRIVGDYNNPESEVVTKVTGDPGPNNLFSVTLDTRLLPITDHIVTVSDGTVTGSALFNILAGTGTGNAGTGTGTYIRIDPVADKTTGDLLTVTGSTNLPAGTILMVQAGSAGVGFGSDTMVREGTGGINRFSLPVDTSILKPGILTITVTEMKGDLAKGDYKMGTLNGTTSFTLKGTYLGADAPVKATITGDTFISLNPIGDHAAGDQFLITGTTSLPVGTSLIWEIMPDTGTPPASLDLNATGIMANNAVTKGTGAANRVSLAVDMNNMKPGKWVVLVGVMKGEPNSGSIEIENLTGTAYFTLN